MADVETGDEILEGQLLEESDKVRAIVAATYTFVRSAEINRTIASFTLDHYIDEAKRAIKSEGRAVRNAAGESFDLRPSKLDALLSLEKQFTDSFAVIEALAKKADTDEGEVSA